jgi:hypothetical protein
MLLERADTTTTPTLDLLLHEVKRVDFTAAREELSRLQAIERWAITQQPFQVGARVRIAADYAVPQFLKSGEQHGWWVYRDVLHPGALGTVTAVDFNWVWHYWYADIALDREWWTDAQGVQHDIPPENRHVWGFQPRWLEAVDA